MAIFVIQVDDSQAQKAVTDLSQQIKTDIPDATAEASKSTKGFTDWLGKAATAAGAATIGTLQLTEVGRIATPLFTGLAKHLDKVNQSSQTAAANLKSASNSFGQAAEQNTNAFAKFFRAAAKVGQLLAVVKLARLAHARFGFLQQSVARLVPLTQNFAGSLKNLAGSMQQARTASTVTIPKFAKFGITATIATLAVWGLKKAVDAVFDRVGRIQREAIFGVTPQQIQAIRKELGDVVTSAEAAKHALAFRQAGFGDEQISKAARLANIIGNVAGKSRVASLEMLRSGQISADVLQALRIPQARLLEAFEQAKGKLGETLSPIQQSRIAIDLLDRQVGKLGPTVKAAFPVNPFKVFGTELRTLWQDLAKFFTTDFAPVIIATAKVIAFALRGLIAPFVLLGKAAAWTLQKIGLARRVKVGTAQAADTLKKALKSQEKAWDSSSKKANANIKALQEWRAKVKAAIDAAKQANSVAREGLSGLLGMASSVFGAQDKIIKDVTLQAIKYGEAVRFGLARNTDAILKLRLAGQLTQRQFEVATQMSLQVQASEEAQKQITLQMRQQAELSRAELVRSGETVALFKLNQQVARDELDTRQIRRRLLDRETVLMNQLIKAEVLASKSSGARKQIYLSQVFALRGQLGQHRALAKATEQQIKLNRMNLFLQGQQAALQAKFAKSQFDLAQLRAVQDQIAGTNQLILKLKEVNGTLTAQTRIAVEGQQQIRALERARIDNLQKIQQAQAQIDAGLARGEKLRRLELEIGAYKQQNQELLQQEKLVRQITAAQQQQFTTLGAFFQAAQAQVAELSQQAGQQLYQSFQGFTGGIGNLISSAFQTIVSGSDNLGEVVGKGFLDALSGMAAQLGAFFIAAGTAQMFVPPYTGAGAIAGGVGLLALAGALKGITSLIGAKPPTVSTGGGASVSPSFSTTPVVTAQSTERPQRPVEINNYYNGVPWRGGTARDQDFRDFVRWNSEGERATGRKVGARR